MTREAELPDGTVLEFPDETTDEVVQRTVKRSLGLETEEQGIVSKVAGGAYDQVAAGALAASDLVTGGAGALVATPKAIYDVARGDVSPTQALEGVGAAGSATAEAASGYIPQEQKDVLRGKEAYSYPMDVLNKVFQGVGNIAGAARYYGGQALGEDEAQSAQRAGELGAGAQLGAFAAAPFLRGSRPVVEPSRPPSLKTQEAIRDTYVDPTQAIQEAARKAGIELPKAEPTQAPEAAPVSERMRVQQAFEEAIAKARVDPVEAEALPERIRVQKAFEEAIAKARQEPVTPGEPTPEPTRPLPPRGETGAVGHLDRLSSLEKDLIKYQEELRDATRREEKDTVKYFKEAIEEVKATMEDLKTKYEEQPPIDPFRGPGRRQAGALVFDGTESPRLRKAFEFIKERWPRFSELRDIKVMKDKEFDAYLMKSGYPSRDIGLVSGFLDTTNNRLAVPESLGKNDLSRVIGVMAHELRHAFDAKRKPNDQKYWGSRKLTAQQMMDTPAEVKAFAAGDTAQARYEAKLPKGPGRRQSGMFDPTTFRASKQAGDTRTEFEKEQKLPAGAGLALPDTEGPVLDRVVETLAMGEDLNAKKGTPQKVNLPNDIGSFLGKYGLTTELATKFYHDNPLLKTIVDRFREIDQKFGNMLEDLMKGSQLRGQRGLTALGYTQRVRDGFLSIAEKLPKNEVESLYKAWLEFDNSPILREQKLMYPTMEMLRQAGYSERVAKAYLAEAEYMKLVYGLVNKARALSGKKPMEFLPGHFPHTYKGNIGIKILRRVRDELGEPKDVTVGYTRTSGSQKQIDKVIKTLMDDIYKELEAGGSKDMNLHAEQVRTDKPGNMADIMDAFESVSEVYSSASHPVTQLVKKVLDNRVASMEQQFLASSLHRSGVKGWLGYTGVTSKNLRDLQAARTSYVQNAIKFARSQEMLHVMDQIPSNVWVEVQRRLPNTAHFIERFVDTARERTPLSEVDKFVLDAVDSIFGPRLNYRSPLTGVHKLRGFFSTLDLGWSLAYHTANFLQPTVYSPAALLREFARIGKGDPTTALAKGTYEFYNPSLETKRAMEYAAKHKHITPKLMEEIDFRLWEGQNKLGQLADEMATGRRGSETNEAVGRGKVFLHGYYYYKSVGMTNYQAMRAAGKFVEDVMVGYDKVGQNLWLSSNPAGQFVGKMVAPYAQFQFNHWGHMALILQGIKRNPGNARSYLPLIELQAATMLLAGVRGITGFAQLSVMWTGLNMAYEWATGEKSKWPDLRTLMVKAGFGDVAMFGAVSSAVGSDVGASMAAPELTGLVNFRQVQGSADILTKTFPAVGKIIMAKELTDSEKLQALNAITPKWMHRFWEMNYSQDPRVVPDPNNRMRGSIKETQKDKDLMYWTGKRSLQQERERIVSRDLQQTQRQRNELKSDLVELAADQVSRRGRPDAETLRKAHEAGYKMDEFRKRVRELMKQRGQTRIESVLRGREATRNRMMQRERFEDLRDDLDVYNAR